MGSCLQFGDLDLFFKFIVDLTLYMLGIFHAFVVAYRLFSKSSNSYFSSEVKVRTVMPILYILNAIVLAL